jgi:hypothetical protein
MHHQKNPILGVFGWDETQPHDPIPWGEFLFFSHGLDQNS